MRVFDYSFLENGLLPAGLIHLTSAIASLKTMADVRKQEYPRVFAQMEAAAGMQSVKSANAIEGIVTSDERIAAIVHRGSALPDRTEGAIAGYRDELRAIGAYHATLDFRQAHMVRLHQTMMQIAGYPYGGRYKTDDNYIIEQDPDGIRRIVFSPTPAALVSEAMEQLELAYMEASNNANIHPLLLIPCVVLDFLCIHPFRDGNGRMSLLLSLLLLYKNGYDVGRYVSFEEQIRRDTAYGGQAFRESLVGWHENQNTYIPFIRQFLTELYLCYKELDQRFAIVHGKTVTKTARIEATVLHSPVPISKAEICEIVPDVSPTTVEAVLGKMVKQGQIKKLGESRMTRYIRAQAAPAQL